ncbi:MAG: hypothetical protein IKX90_02505, partial [Verrucomicrobia bacterium]|nr:hypothetical protein [Verrucomicrobiota bacterium]
VRDNIMSNEREIDSLRSTLLEILKDEELARAIMDQKNWRRNEGKIDSSLFTLTEDILRDSVIPYCYEAAQYQEENKKTVDPVLMELARKYIAQPQATEMILKEMREENSPVERYNSILKLSLDKRFPKNVKRINFDAYKLKPAAGTELVDAETARMANERLTFLDAAAAQFADDEKMQRVIGIVRSNLQYSAGEGADMNAWIPDESIQKALHEISDDVIEKAIDEELEKTHKKLEEEIEKRQQ